MPAITKSNHVLIVEDDADIMELMRFNCEKEGFVTTAAGSAEDALRLVESVSPALILVDLMLPGIDGLALCRVLKSNVLTRGVPIIMVTAKGEEADIVAGLEQGAEDYITKPFSPRVLIARLKAVLRRHGASVHDQQEPLTVGELTIHPGKRAVQCGSRQVASRPPSSRSCTSSPTTPAGCSPATNSSAAVHGPGLPGNRPLDRRADRGVRKKLGSCNQLIETVRGVGYRFQDATT